MDFFSNAQGNTHCIDCTPSTLYNILKYAHSHTESFEIYKKPFPTIYIEINPLGVSNSLYLNGACGSAPWNGAYEITLPGFSNLNHTGNYELAKKYLVSPVFYLDSKIILKSFLSFCINLIPKKDCW